MASDATPPSLFISHGAGPMWLLKEQTGPFAALSSESSAARFHRDFGKQLRREYPALRAILVVTAHWETRAGAPLRVTTAEAHSPLYDYGGFSPEAYEIQYSPPGEPSVARDVVRLLGEAGVRCEEDPKRKLDHGVFVPLKLLYPDADVPVVALSISSSLDLAFHARVGEALRALRSTGVLVIGSGQLTHERTTTAQVAETFHEYLEQAIALPGAERIERIVEIERRLPKGIFRACHGREDHFVPLAVAAAAGDDDTPGEMVFDHIQPVMGFTIDLSTIQFGGAKRAGGPTL